MSRYGHQTGWNASATPTYPETELTLELSASENNVKVRDRLGNPSGVLTVTISILAGVEIGAQHSVPTLLPALDVQEGWAPGTTFIVDFNGESDNKIQGAGGRGGSGSAPGSGNAGGGGGGGGAGLMVGGFPVGGVGGLGPNAAAAGTDGSATAAGSGGHAASAPGDPGGQIGSNGQAGGVAIHMRGYDMEIIGGVVSGGGGGGGGGDCTWMFDLYLGGYNTGTPGANGGGVAAAGSNAATATGGAAGAAIVRGGGVLTQTDTPTINGSIAA